VPRAVFLATAEGEPDRMSQQIVLRGASSTAQGQPQPRPLSRPMVVAVAVLLFFLAGTNGRPFVWSSAAPAIVIAGVLALGRSPKALWSAVMSVHYRPFTIPLLILLIWTGISAFVAGTDIAIVEFLLRSLVPFLVYVSLAGVALSREDVPILLLGFVAGVCFLLARAILAFYVEWGIPDLETLLWARYDLVRMAGYMDQGLGNVSHMGLYTAMLLPMLIFAGFAFRWSMLIRWLLYAAIVLGLLNLVVSGARTALVLVVLMMVPIMVRKGIGSTLAFFGVFGLVAMVAIAQLVDAVSRHSLIERFIPSAGYTGIDVSAEERFSSIALGWRDFLNHPVFGIGPGMSPEYNPFGIPHESLVHMLSETGLVGGLTYLALSLIVIWRFGMSSIRQSIDGNQHWRMLFLIAPASWCLFGLAAGTAFTMSVALLWVGLFHAFIALAYARVADRPAAPVPQPSVRPKMPFRAGLQASR
jgi:O-antigen ligase